MTLQWCRVVDNAFYELLEELWIFTIPIVKRPCVSEAKKRQVLQLGLYNIAVAKVLDRGEVGKVPKVTAELRVVIKSCFESRLTDGHAFYH